MNKTRMFVAAIGIGLVSAAVVTELRKPAARRTWEGRLGGVMPYEFRPPTADRVQQRMWNPDGPLFTPHVFGVGWTVNAGHVARRLGIR